MGRGGGEVTGLAAAGVQPGKWQGERWGTARLWGSASASLRSSDFVLMHREFAWKV